ncbi:MAG TPA: VanZ family protein [Candidatus Acidoferrum sp.]
MVLGILMATLWPFHFFPTNNVEWLQSENGLRFHRDGVVISTAYLNAPGAEAGNGCTLELMLRPASTESSGVILNFYSPDNPRRFQVRQWTDGLLVTHELPGPQNKLRKTKFDVDHAFQSGQLLLLTITSGQNSTVVYLNGRHAQSFPKFKISCSEWTGRLAIGSSAVDYEPWQGEIYGLAIYPLEFSTEEVSRRDYSWSEGHAIRNVITPGPDLEIPKHFVIPVKAFLKSPGKEFEPSRDYLDDVLRNVAGFVPLGFLLGGYWGWGRARRQAVLYAILAGGMLSLVIEVLQAYIPQRNSGVTDIMTNTLGAALGALLAAVIFGRAKSSTE